jgi:hypothetical protein
MKNLLQHIFLSSDPDNEDLKVLVYDSLYIPWLKGDFLPEFALEYTGSYLIPLRKPSGGIRGIAPVDIWRRAFVCTHLCTYDTRVRRARMGACRSRQGPSGQRTLGRHHTCELPPFDGRLARLLGLLYSDRHTKFP